jgi:hypothetical protein
MRHWWSHSGSNDDSSLLGCYAVSTGKQLTAAFQSSVAPPSPVKHSTWHEILAHLNFINTSIHQSKKKKVLEDGGSTIPRKWATIYQSTWCNISEDCIISTDVRTLNLAITLTITSCLLPDIIPQLFWNCPLRAFFLIKALSLLHQSNALHFKYKY